jgi:Spy/CpxP family protein refolding chaperone
LREKRLALTAQLDSLRLQMDRALSEDAVDDAAVLELAQKISDVRGKRFVQKMEARLTLGKVLNAEQIEKLNWQKMYQKRKHPGQGKKAVLGHRSARQQGNRWGAEN